jgi:hypothetical protein
VKGGKPYLGPIILLPLQNHRSPGDVSVGTNLPQEKEPPHRGDIGCDRFLLRQFGLESYSLFPSYKLCDNRTIPGLKIWRKV